MDVVVGAAVIDGERLLATRRAYPAVLAGRWEFPGGKVEPGESEVEALVRECREELGIDVAVGARVGPDAAIPPGVLRVYACVAVSGTLALTEHDEARRLGAAELGDVPWIPADVPVVAAVRDLLAGGEPVVALRPWAEGDHALLVAANSPEMTEHLGGPESPEKLADRHRRYLALNEPGAGRMHAIVVAGQPEPVGIIGFWEKEWRGGTVYEAGWHVLTAYQGRGIAPRAAALVVERARAAGRHRWLHAFPGPDHPASNAVCRKVGFELLGEYDFEYPPGNPVRCNDWRYDLLG